MQIADKIEDDIIEARLPEETQVPSTNQFAPLPDQSGNGRQRRKSAGGSRDFVQETGIGMFVASGARELLMEKRKTEFYEQYVVAMVKEAAKLGITKDQLSEMIRRGEQD